MERINLLTNNAIIVPAMKIKKAYTGFTRYLIQNKNGADYMNSDMSKNFIFYEPINKKVFKIFSDYSEDRENVIKVWNYYVSDKSSYLCQNVEFVNEEYQEEIDDIFNCPNQELATIMQNIADIVVKKHKNYDICIGVVHGEQLTNGGIRYPHAHILLKEKRKEK